MHARLLRRMAPAAATGSAVVRGRRPPAGAGKTNLAGPTGPGSRTAAKAKADTKTTAEGFPVHSLKTLLADLATLTLNQVTLPTNPTRGSP